MGDKMKKALITGITGQDGSYLAEFLLEKGYEVHGIDRHVAIEDQRHRYSRLNHIMDKLHMHPCNITNYGRVYEIIDEIKPDEVYHLAAQSFVYESFIDSFNTMDTNINGTHNILQALYKLKRDAKFYFAASSEMFGKVHEVPQKETTKFHPRSPYGVTKVAGFWLSVNYREAYGMFCCNGILFNHESPRRGKEFVTRKITDKIADIKKGKDNVLVLGNIMSKRDWGHSKDYIEGMWMMLQQPKPDDYVLATGETHTVKEFLDVAFEAVNLKYELVDLHNNTEEDANNIIEEIRQKPERIFVVQHPIFYRPSEVDLLLGDATKAKEVLGWQPKIKFSELVAEMVEKELK